MWCYSSSKKLYSTRPKKIQMMNHFRNNLKNVLQRTNKVFCNVKLINGLNIYVRSYSYKTAWICTQKPGQIRTVGNDLQNSVALAHGIRTYLGSYSGRWVGEDST